jgi:hypothetical protein
MSFVRSLPVFISIIVSACLWLAGFSLVPTRERGTYAVLVCNEAVPDRDIKERLEDQGFSGIVSESGQWVLLDAFGSMEQIPLDQFNSRLLPFDPRNDGYAEKLRSMFVQDEKRFIYIPLRFTMPAKLAGVEKRLALALGDIPYLYYSDNTGARRQTGLPLVLFCLAAFAFFAARPLRSALQPHAACLIPCLPPLAPLALAGAEGLALASLLAGFAALLAGPCLNWLSRSHGLSRQQLSSQKRRQLKMAVLLSPPLLLCYGLLSFFSNIPPVFFLLVLASFCGIFALSLLNTSRAGDAGVFFGGLAFRWRKRQRFSPVLILKPPVSGSGFSWAMLPFAAAAAILAIAALASFHSGAAAPPILPVAAASEEDYLAHYLFQSTFSVRPLYSGDLSEAMGVFGLAPDGLLAPIPAEQYPSLDGMPPFPLKDFLHYLDSEAPAADSVYSLLFALLPLFFIVPAFIKRRKS